MQHIQAPSLDKGIHPLSLFLAGTVKGYPWRQYLLTKLMRFDVTVFNPKLNVAPTNPIEIRLQNQWEYHRIRRARLVVFWFGPETSNPMSLFELGAALTRRETQEIFIGIDDNHKLGSNIKAQCDYIDQGYYTSFSKLIIAVHERIEDLI